MSKEYDEFVATIPQDVPSGWEHHPCLIEAVRSVRTDYENIGFTLAATFDDSLSAIIVELYGDDGLRIDPVKRTAIAPMRFSIYEVPPDYLESFPDMRVLRGAVGRVSFHLLGDVYTITIDEPIGTPASNLFTISLD